MNYTKTNNNMVDIEIVYVNDQQEYFISLKVPLQTTVEQAIKLSGLLLKAPEIQLFDVNKTGIFGKLCDRKTLCQSGDRIEIYRPLREETMRRRFRKVKAARKRYAQK